jgi:hypothetical protein
MSIQKHLELINIFSKKNILLKYPNDSFSFFLSIFEVPIENLLIVNLDLFSLMKVSCVEHSNSFLTQ